MFYLNGFLDALILERIQVTSSSESIRFDSVLEFKAPFLSKHFVIVDVYAKMPVTKCIVQSFIKRIRWAQNKTLFSDEKAENECYPLRGKTLGTIVSSTASIAAFNYTCKNDIAPATVCRHPYRLQPNKQKSLIKPQRN